MKISKRIRGKENYYLELVDGDSISVHTKNGYILLTLDAHEGKIKLHTTGKDAQHMTLEASQ